MRHADVPMPLLLLAAHQEGLASGAQCDDEGFGRHRRRRLVNAGRAARAAQGVIDLTPVAVEAGLAIRSGPDHDRRRAALLALLGCGPRAVSVGRCALALLGVEGLPRAITPEVVLPGGSARAERDGIVVRRYRTAALRRDRRSGPAPDSAGALRRPFTAERGRGHRIRAEVLSI